MKSQGRSEWSLEMVGVVVMQKKADCDPMAGFELQR